MAAFTLRRLFHAAVSFIGITVAVFLLVHAAPGDPVQLHLGGLTGRGVSPEVVAALRAELKLDEPLVAQYAGWLRGVVTLDFGRSFVDRRPVIERVGEKLPRTLALNVVALAIALAIAVPLGVGCARRPGKAFDRLTAIVMFVCYTIPAFWLALMLSDFFSVRLAWLPLFGMRSAEHAELGALARASDLAAHAVLPVATLALAQLAIFWRFTRASVLEAAGRDFVRTARAKGVPEGTVLVRHALRSALSPLITVLALVVPYLLSGSVVVERIFRWDGIGNMYVESVVARDYPTVMALTVLTSLLALAASIGADLLYAATDPRVRLEDRR